MRSAFMAGVVAISVVLAADAGMAPASAQRCEPGYRTLADNGRVRLYFGKGDTEDGGVFACWHQRPVLLREVDFYESALRGAVGGRFASVVTQVCDSHNQCDEQLIEVFDVARSRRISTTAINAGSVVSDLVTRATGAAAFITRRYERDPPYRTIDASVWLLRPRVAPRLVDTGNIDPESLVQRRDKISWVKDGARVNRTFG